MTFDLNAPARQAIPFDLPEKDLANIVIHDIFAAILRGRGEPSFTDPALVLRHDFVHNGSRMALVSTVAGCGTEVTVTYSGSLLQSLHTLIATSLRWLLCTEVVMSDDKFICIVPSTFNVDSSLLDAPTTRPAPDLDAPIMAETTLDETVGTRIQDFKQDPYARRRFATVELQDSVYGEVHLDYEVKLTHERLPSNPGGFRLHHVGELRLRLCQINLVDWLSEVVDLAAFARKHDLELVSEADEYCYWTFRFQGHPVVA